MTQKYELLTTDSITTDDENYKNKFISLIDAVKNMVELIKENYERRKYFRTTYKWIIA